jgi:hypothetical protein
LAKLVSEEKILNDFFLSNFLFSAMAAMLVGSGIIGYNSDRGPPKAPSILPSLVFVCEKKYYRIRLGFDFQE